MTLSRHVVIAVVAVGLALAFQTALVSAASAEDREKMDEVPSIKQMDVYDVVGLVIMGAALALSAAGGVGGGIVMVPTMILVMGFDVKVATPISNLGIFGGGIANAIFNSRKRHPKADRPLIEPDLVIIMIPAVIGGVVIGTVLTNFLPSYLLSLLMVVVLVAGNSRMLVKAISMVKQETAAKKEARMIRADVETPNSPDADYVIAAESPSTKRSEGLRAAAERGDESIDPELIKLIDQEKYFNKTKHGAVFACYLLIVAVSIADALVTCGSVTYWFLLAVEFPCIVIFEIFVARLLLKEYEHKVALNYPFVDGDMRWSKKTLSIFAPACVAAGIVAGTFGVGAAAITGPVLIEMGTIPEVLAAMSALMILYSSAAATAKYAVFNMIKWDWAMLVFALSLVVTSLAQYFILGYVRRSGRQSIILLAIVSTAFTGAALMLYEGIKLTIEDSGASFSINVCD